MSWRQWVNNNPITATGIAGGLLLVALLAVFLAARTPAAPQPDQAWFFDVGTGELFMRDWEHIPPVEPPSSATLDDGTPGGVRAHVFTCGGDCSREADRFIGYLETYSVEVKEQRLALVVEYGGRPDSLSPAILRNAGLENDRGRFLARPDEPNEWFPIDSDEGRRIATEPGRRCEQDVQPHRCWARTR